MKRFISLVICLFSFAAALRAQPKTLLPATKIEFEKGKKAIVLTRSKQIVKKKGVLVIPNCKSFRDDNSDENYKEFEYLGGFSGNWEVVRELTSNGTSSIIINSASKCSQIPVPGGVWVFDSVIVNFNESETTDVLCFVEFRSFEHVSIGSPRRVNLPSGCGIVEVRMSDKGELLWMDGSKKYWKMTIPR